MPITKYTQPIQAEYVQQYQPLPLQAIANAAQAREKRHQEALARRDKFIRTAQQIPTATEEDQRIVNQRLQEARQRIGDVAQDGDFSNALYDVQNIATEFAGDEQIQNITQSASAIEEYNEQLDEMVRSGDIDPIVAQGYRRRSMAAYQPGEGVFSGVTPYPSADVEEVATQAANEVEAEEHKRQPVVGPYGVTQETREVLDPERVRGAVRNALQKPQVVESLRQEWLSRKAVGDSRLAEFETFEDFVNDRIEKQANQMAAQKAGVLNIQTQKLAGLDALQDTKDVENRLTTSSPAMSYTRAGVDNKNIQDARSVSQFSRDLEQRVQQANQRMEELNPQSREYQALEDQLQLYSNRMTQLEAAQRSAQRQTREEFGVQFDESGNIVPIEGGKEYSNKVHNKLQSLGHKEVDDPNSPRWEARRSPKTGKIFYLSTERNMPTGGREMSMRQMQETVLSPAERLQNYLTGEGQIGGITGTGGTVGNEVAQEARKFYDQKLVQEAKNAFKVEPQSGKEVVINEDNPGWDQVTRLFNNNFSSLNYKDVDGSTIDEQVIEKVSDGTHDLVPVSTWLIGPNNDPYVRARLIDKESGEISEEGNIIVQGGPISSFSQNYVGSTPNLGFERYIERNISGDISGEEETISMPKSVIDRLGFNAGLGKDIFRNIDITRREDGVWSVDANLSDNVPQDMRDAINNDVFSSRSQIFQAISNIAKSVHQNR